MKPVFIPVADAEGSVGYVNIDCISAICRSNQDTIIVLVNGIKLKSGEDIQSLLNKIETYKDS